MSADTIYLNQISLSYLADKKNRRINTQHKENQRKNMQVKPKPIPKDHFEYNYELDAFKCLENQYLYFFNKYIEPHKDPKKLDKIKRLYNNYEAVKTVKQETNAVHLTNTQNYHRIQLRNAKSNEPENGKTII